MINNPFLERDRQIMGDIYTSAEPMENLLMLCDVFGSRFAGSQQERDAAVFMKEKLESYGLANVRLEAVQYNGWQRGEATLEIVEPESKKLSCITLPHSPAVDLKGQLCDVGEGAPDDFDKHAAEIAGKFVMTTSHTYPSGSKRWIHRNEKYGRSLLAGAQAFIFVNHYPGYGPATGGIGYDGPLSGVGLIPGLSLSMEDGAYLQRLLKRHKRVTVHLRSTDINEPVTSLNVIAELPGKKDPDSIIMLGCHYDGHDISQGAADPASGTVALMEAARVLKKYASDLPNTIRFALWSAEEIGLVGSTQYVQQHQNDLDKLRFYLNMDMAGAIDPKDIVINEWPALERLFRSWQAEMALDYGVGQSLNAHSDHYPFMLAGVPSGAIGSLKPRLGGRGYGHTMYDTIDKVELKGMREAASLAARIALRIATVEQWPVKRRSSEEVRAILDNPDYREETKLTEQVKTIYRQQGQK